MQDDDSSVKGLRFAKALVWLVYLFFMVALVILVMAFFLLLFNASPSASFTEWVYRSASKVLAPFRGIFPSAESENGSVISFAVLFAIIMYGIFALAVHALVDWLDDKVVERRAAQMRERAEVERTAYLQAETARSQQPAQVADPAMSQPQPAQMGAPGAPESTRQSPTGTTQDDRPA
ncbi:MAG: hypothetical protein ACR2OH_09335 [Microthrixaceae bacterium]